MNAAKVLEDLKRRFPNEPEYHQAVEEVLSTIEEEYNKHPEFDKVNLIERLCIPDRVYQFRVTWMDDKGNIQTNMGYRVQHNNAIGPYKGGIRFHASVNLSILKFLAFEQTFKNSLTTLPMGGGKGGSDFSPRGKSNAEVMRFVQAFMLELWRHIGPETDVPAGDIGVGGREVGFMFGMYKKLTREFTGTFTGKGREFGGSLIRPEATGYGNIYFLMENVEGAKPWGEKADIALPSATQNELNGDHARQLVANGCMAVSEGANMPSTPEAIKVFQDAKILYAPGKAANAGGVSVSGLEMTQNSIKLSWSSEEVDEKLKSIMKNIHEACVQYGTEADGYVNYVKGANVAGFMKVAKAMMAQGIV